MSTPTIKPHQVAESFVAVPGIRVEVTEIQPATLIDIGTDYTQFLPPTGSKSFVVPVAGNYAVQFTPGGFASSSLSGVTGMWKLVVDEGTSDEQIIGDDLTWQIRCDGYGAMHRTLLATVSLTTGSHTLKGYAKETSGTTLRLYDSSTLPDGDHVAVFTLVSGSGAGGALTQLTGEDVDQTVSQDIGSAPYLVAAEGIGQTVVVSGPNDVIGIKFTGRGQPTASTYTGMYVGLFIDGAAYLLPNGGYILFTTSHSTAGQPKNVSCSIDISGLSAGSHTINMGLARSSSNWISDQRSFSTTVYRGGLVPVQHDGVDVLSTPRAFNFQGTSLQITEENDVVNIGLGPAVTAPGDLIIISDGPPTSALLVNSGSDHQIMPETGSLSFEAKVNGTYMILFSGELIAPSSNSSAQIKLVFDEGEVNEQTVGYTEGWLTRPTTGNYTEPVFKDQVDLTAGTHTVKAYGKIVEGTSIQITTGNVHPLVLTLQAIIGSGAGGSIESVGTMSGALSITGTESPAAHTHVPELDLSVATNGNERIQVHFLGSAYANIGTANCYVHLKVDGVYVPSGSWIVSERLSALYDNRNLCFSYVTDVLSAGTHTIQLYAAKYDAVQSNWQLNAGQLTARIYRGGLVPIREDGVTILDKPAALNFQGAAIVEDAAGVANIRLPEAITAPGAVIRIVDPQPVSDINLTTSDTLLVGPYSFQTRVAGLYAINVSGTLCVGALGTAHFKIVFDEGEANEQTYGYDNDPDGWRVRDNSSQYAHLSLNGTLTLAAGNHTVKFYGKEDATQGGSWYYQGSTYIAQGLAITLQAVTGSGAGGVLVDRVSSTSFPQTITAGFDLGNYDDINDLSTTVEVAEGEQLLITLRAQGLPVTTSSAVGRTRILVGTTPYLVAQVSATTQLDMNLGGSVVTEPLTAGTYTVKAQAANNSTLADIYINLWADMEVTRFRGGLVPILNDGVLIQDKPHAINLLGPGLQAVNLDGKVNVSVQTATEGLSAPNEHVQSGTRTITATTFSPVPTEPMTVIFNTVEGETVWIGCTVRGSGNGGADTLSVQMRLDGTLVGMDLADISDSGGWPCVLTDVIPIQLGAGTHTLDLYARTSPAQQWDMFPGSRVFVSQMRGGYVVPENVPELVYNTASIINVAPRAGTSSRLWVHLNDGVRYHADGTLTINLASSGLGGLDTGTEAVSTWYYCYAVPSTTSGEFGVVASVTDPGSGGPTGFTAWKYLGAVRNDSSGDLRKWYQLGAKFKTAAIQHTIGAGVDATPQSLSLTTDIPLTAGSYICLASIINSLNNATLQIWPDGDQAGTEWARIYAAVNSDTACSYLEVPTLTAPKALYYKRTTSGGTVAQCIIWTHGWIDQHLLDDGKSQTQTEYTPDTPPPRGTWIDATEVDFAAWPGHSSTMRLALSDAKTRIASGTLAVDTANGVADLGYDDASSQGNTKWLYFYAVPKTGDDDQFTVVMSDNPPTTGPLGRSASKYLWSTYIDGSGNLVKVYQVEPSRFQRADNLDLNIGGGSDGSPVSLSLASYVPETSAAVTFHNYTNGSGTYSLVEFWANGDQAGGPTILNTTDYRQTLRLVIPTPTSPKIMYYKRSASISACLFYFDGWIDGYLAADAGIGAVTGGAGTASPLTTKGDLYTYDTDNQRLPVGSNGQVLTADSAEATGIKWAAISHPTQAYLREETFSTAGTETPGETVSHVIAATPRAAGTTCGYDIVVHRNGVKMKNVASLASSYNEFTFTVGTLTVAVLASGDADEYDVDFRS